MSALIGILVSGIMGVWLGYRQGRADGIKDTLDAIRSRRDS